jgi:hypothetical protein
MTEKPALDPELHEDDTVVSVWKRRMILFLLILLVVAVSAPAFSGCGGALASKKVVATFEVAGKTHDVTGEDLDNFMSRFNAMERLFTTDPRQSRGLPEGEEGVKQALSMLMLDEAAKAEGIAAPDALVASFIAKLPMFQVSGKFDEGRYRGVLSEYGRGILTHETFSALIRMQVRVQEYQSVYGAAFEVVPGDQAYDAWRKRNAKLTVAWVASHFDAQRAKFADAHPTEEELKAIEALPSAQAVLDKPPSKTIEAAYIKAADMSDAQYEAAKQFAEAAEIFTEERPLVDEAKTLYHFNRETAFTRERWVALAHPDYAATRDAAQKARDAWAALPKEEQEKTKEPPIPEDPATKYPEEERAQFPLWRDRTEKEVLAREIVRKFATDAERGSKSFADLAADYSKYGVKVVKNPEPLPDKELIEKFPDAVARDSEFDQVAFGRFRPAPEGQVFKPIYHVEPVPTTRLADRLADRGFMVMRLESCDPARKHPIHEKVNELLDIWRKYKVAESAKRGLDEVKKAAEAAGTEVDKIVPALEKAAADAGLKVETLRKFNRKTEAPKPPTAAPGQTLSPELAALARAATMRNRVQQSYQQLSMLAPGKFLDVMVDEKLEAALLVLLVEKSDPAPLEMQDSELRQERMALYQSDTRSKLSELVGFDALAKRYKLVRHVEKKKDEDVKPQ